uniref:Uncharacterized protein n=1 Tax=Panagrolaimus sp. JU765 TaxID=591449 RepID=A0AC34PZB6_9BILA
MNLFLVFILLIFVKTCCGQCNLAQQRQFLVQQLKKFYHPYLSQANATKVVTDFEKNAINGKTAAFSFYT